MSQFFIKISDNDIDKIYRIKQNPNSDLNSEIQNLFLKNKIITENDDFDLAQHINNILIRRYNSSNMNLTILTTNLCNFCCSYCYEEGINQTKMNKEVESDILNFVKMNENLKSLHIVWFGGEPLLNFESIVNLTYEFLKLGINYQASMVTNAYLLTKEKAELFEELKIDTVQITLDGEEKYHNIRRPLKNGDKTFDTIITNINSLLEINKNVKVKIRTNLDKHSMDNYSKVYFTLNNLLKNNKQITYYPGFLHDQLGTGCVSSDIVCDSVEEKLDFYIDNYIKSGINLLNFLPKRQLHGCIANNNMGFVIDPSGDVYKCWSVMGHENYKIGNVHNPEKFSQSRIARFLCDTDYIFDDKCRECYFMPICTGGCPLVRLINKYENKNVDHCCMAKYNLDRYLELFYEQSLKK